MRKSGQDRFKDPESIDWAFSYARSAEEGTTSLKQDAHTQRPDRELKKIDASSSDNWTLLSYELWFDSIHLPPLHFPHRQSWKREREREREREIIDHRGDRLYDWVFGCLFQFTGELSRLLRLCPSRFVLGSLSSTSQHFSRSFPITLSLSLSLFLFLSPFLRLCQSSAVVDCVWRWLFASAGASSVANSRAISNRFVSLSFCVCVCVCVCF